MIFNRRTITKLLDLVNLQRHNDNYADIQTDLTNHEGRITGAQSDITTHKASTAAHPAEHVTYEGEVIGAENIKDGLDIIKTELDQAIISGDSGPEAAASRYNPFTGVTHATLPDRLNEEWEQTATQLADEAHYRTQLSQQSNKVKVVAHRGLPQVAPENTIPAFIAAGKARAWGCETDVMPTADGKWVIMHDDAVDRMTDGTGLVSDLTLLEIKTLKIDAGSNVGLYPNLRVPTLEEYLIVCKNFNLVPQMELKGVTTSANYDVLVATIKKYGFEAKCLVTSAWFEALHAVRDRSQIIQVVYVTNAMYPTTIEDTLALGNVAIAVEIPVLTQALMDTLHAAGLRVNAWMIDDYANAKKYIAMGADYITTNKIIDVGW
jgi:glycerophosphoryl diester phosphodiesterase